MTVERFSTSKYEIYKRVASVKTDGPSLGHGQGVSCASCHLAMAVYGCGLTRATDGVGELRDGLGHGPHATPLKMLAHVRAIKS